MEKYTQILFIKHILEKSKIRQTFQIPFESEWFWEKYILILLAFVIRGLCYKTFYWHNLLMGNVPDKLRVFVPGRPFQLSLIFAGRALLANISLRLKRLVRDKHCSLLGKFINYCLKKFYKHQYHHS